MLDCTRCTVTVSIFQRCQGVSRFQCLESFSHAVDTRDVKHIVEHRLDKDELCPEPDDYCCYSLGGCTLGLVSRVLWHLHVAMW